MGVFWQRRCRDLRNIQQFRATCRRDLGKRVAEHRIAEWTSCAHHFRACSGEFLRTLNTNPLPFLLT